MVFQLDDITFTFLTWFYFIDLNLKYVSFAYIALHGEITDLIFLYIRNMIEQ